MLSSTKPHSRLGLSSSSLFPLYTNVSVLSTMWKKTVLKTQLFFVCSLIHTKEGVYTGLYTGEPLLIWSQAKYNYTADHIWAPEPEFVSSNLIWIWRKLQMLRRFIFGGKTLIKDGRLSFRSSWRVERRPLWCPRRSPAAVSTSWSSPPPPSASSPRPPSPGPVSTWSSKVGFGFVSNSWVFAFCCQVWSTIRVFNPIIFPVKHGVTKCYITQKKKKILQRVGSQILQQQCFTATGQFMSTFFLRLHRPTAYVILRSTLTFVSMVNMSVQLTPSTWLEFPGLYRKDRKLELGLTRPGVSNSVVTIRLYSLDYSIMY